MKKSKIYDKDFRAKLVSNPKEQLKAITANIIEDIEYKVVKETKNKTYFIIPQDDKSLLSISAAGGTAHVQLSTAGTAGSVGTLVSTIGTVGSLGTYGCVDTVVPV